MTRQVWVKAICDGESLTNSLLGHLGVKISVTPSTLLRDQFNVRLRVSQLFIMPSFNQFLGGRPINAKGREKDARTIAFIGPVLRSRSVNLDDAEVYLLDGTFLGTINQLRILT